LHPQQRQQQHILCSETLQNILETIIEHMNVAQDNKVTMHRACLCLKNLCLQHNMCGDIIFDVGGVPILLNIIELHRHDTILQQIARNVLQMVLEK
jgi:hypothetical protein